MSKKRGLGRGLSALLENAETDITTGTQSESATRVLGSVAYLPIDKIEVNPFQPRSTFDQESLDELAQSIDQYGIIQPLTVRKMGHDTFQLISGERRFRAAQIAGLEEVPSYIRVANDQTMLEMALVENIQRQDLDAIEVAMSYQRLIEECKLTQEGLSSRVGKKRATISNYLRLLRLSPEIQAAIRLKKVSMGHARALLAVEDPKKQDAIFDRVIEEGLSVRQTEQLVKGTGDQNKQKKESKEPKNEWIPLSMEYQKMRSDLTDHFGSRVGLRCKNDGSGKIEINFSSDDELRRIMDLLEE